MWNDVCNVFHLQLKEQAEFLYNNLPQATQGNWVLLKQAFTDNYQNEDYKWINEQKLADRNQLPGESIDKYIQNVRTKRALLKKGDEEHLCYFMRGILPNVKCHVIAQFPKNLAEAERHARIGQQIAQIQTPKVQTLTASDVFAA